MTDYYVELAQIGSSGRVSFTTNFGFGFIAEFINEKPRSGGRKLHPLRRDRVITLMSVCHQAAFDVAKSNREFSNAEGVRTLSQFVCHLCSAPSLYPQDFVDREYPEFNNAMLQDLTNCVVLTGVDELDAILIVDKLVELVTELWSRIAKGERVRAIIGDYPDELEL